MSRDGFTLVELLIVVVVVGILVGVAWPALQRVTEEGHRREAQDVLLSVYAGERSFFFQNNAYLTLSPFDGNWQKIGIDDPNASGVAPVTFKVVGGAATFTATATRNGGPCNGDTKTIDQDRNVAGTWVVPC
mgnify:CR=1 FL=1